jgi:hypothetical protein
MAFFHIKKKKKGKKIFQKKMSEIKQLQEEFTIFKERLQEEFTFLKQQQQNEFTILKHQQQDTITGLYKRTEIEKESLLEEIGKKNLISIYFYFF